MTDMAAEEEKDRRAENITAAANEPLAVISEEKQKGTGGGGQTVTTEESSLTWEPGEIGKTGKTSYAEIFEATAPRKPEGADDRAKREKRETRRRLMAAIGDGLSAMSNLWFTHRGAPNMYTAKEGMEPKLRERYDKLRKEREADDKEYWSRYMGMLKLDEDRKDKGIALALKRQDSEAARAQKNMELQLKIADNNRKDALARIDLLVKQGKLSEQAAKAKKAEVEAQYAADVQQSIIDKNEAAASNSRAQAQKHLSDAGKNAQHFMGKAYNNINDYTSEVTKAVMQWNADHPDDKIAGVDKLASGILNVNEKLQAANRLAGIYEQKVGFETERYMEQDNKGTTSTMPGVNGAGSGTKMPGVG